jgi:hypothetical protein
MVIIVADTILTEVPLIKIIQGIEMVETYIILIAQLEICIVEEVCIVILILVEVFIHALVVEECTVVIIHLVHVVEEVEWEEEDKIAVRNDCFFFMP